MILKLEITSMPLGDRRRMAVTVREPVIRTEGCSSDPAVAIEYPDGEGYHDVNLIEALSHLITDLGLGRRVSNER